MAKTIELTAETITAKLKKDSLPDVIEWVEKNAPASPLQAQIDSLIAAQKTATESSKAKLQDAVDILTAATEGDNAAYYKLIADALRAIGGAKLFPPEAKATRGRKGKGEKYHTVSPYMQSELAEAGAKIYAALKKAGDAQTSNQLAEFALKGSTVGQAVKAWNAENPEKKIENEGQGRGMKYLLP